MARQTCCELARDFWPKLVRSNQPSRYLLPVLLGPGGKFAISCLKKDRKGFSWSNLAELGKVEGGDLLGLLDLLLVGFDFLLKAFDQPLHAFVVLAVLKRIFINVSSRRGLKVGPHPAETGVP